MVLDRVTARPEDLSGLALPIDCEEAEKVAELDATVEVDVAWIRYDAGLSLFIPHRTWSARFWSTRSAFKFVEVADAVFILVDHTIASTDSNGVENIAFTITKSVCNAFASAYATLVKDVAIAVTGSFWNACTATHATLVKDVALTVALSLGNAIAATDTAFVKNVALTVAGAFRDAITPTYATLVKVEAGPVIRCSG